MTTRPLIPEPWNIVVALVAGPVLVLAVYIVAAIACEICGCGEDDDD